MTDSSDSRERSTIRFPYGDLDDALTVAETIHDTFGTSCDLGDLAGAMHQSISGAFRNKIATAATFGLVETSRGGVSLTDLGGRALDGRTSAAAAVEAFLTVPLYQAVYERFKGKQLPSDQGFEAEITRLGVSAKVAKKARQALQRSAEQAGFFRHGRDRLVQPATVSMPKVANAETAELTSVRLDASSGGVSGGLSGSQHPMLVGLWQELPPPRSGGFGPAKQAEWLEAAKVTLKLLYGGETSPEPRTADDDQ